METPLYSGRIRDFVWLGLLHDVSEQRWLITQLPNKFTSVEHRRITSAKSRSYDAPCLRRPTFSASRKRPLRSTSATATRSKPSTSSRERAKCRGNSPSLKLSREPMSR